MKKVLVGFVSAAALASVSMAMAGGMTSTDSSSNSDSINSGVFMSGDIGVGMPQFENKDRLGSFGTSSYSYDNAGFAWAADLGYQFNQYIGVEAGYMTFGNIEEKGADFDGTSFDNKADLGGFEADVKGMLPLSNTLTLFGKVGTVDMHSDLHSSGVENTIFGLVSYSGTAHPSTWVPMLGAGVSYSVTNQVAVTAEDDYAFRTDFTYNGINTAMPAANDVLAGVTYKFEV